MGPEILIIPLAGIAGLVLLGLPIAVILSRRPVLKWLCALVWLGALLMFVVNYSTTKTFVQNLLLSLMASGLFVVLAFPVVVTGALVALPLKKLFADQGQAPGDAP
jgi:hypothetical protein